MMLKIKNLQKKYGKKIVLNGINLSLDNHIYAIMGENGAGKSTLIKCICGLIKYSGDVEVGCDRELIGYLPQDFMTFEGFTVKETMMFYSRYKTNSSEQEVDRLIDMVGLEEHKNKKATTLSGGMKRRLGLAQSLLGNPKILLLDEPTSGIDPEERLRLCMIIQEISKDKCVLITTHIIQDVENICENVIIMNNGELYYFGDRNELIKKAQNRIIIIDKEEYENRRENYVLVKPLDNNRCRVISMIENESNIKEIPSLEDAYLCCLKNL